MSTDAWDPTQYDRFAAERRQPFFDLLDLVQARQPARVVDFGCGTGELTRILHERLGATETIGVDTSTAMLTSAAAYAGDGVTFVDGDLAAPPAALGDEPLDVIFANASLQWVPDHASVLARWTSMLAPGGELAVQVPTNADHRSHTLIVELAAEEPFLSAMGSPPPPDAVRSVLKPEQYSELLYSLGFAQPMVRLQVYGHVLESAASVVEWVKGTALTRMRRHFSPEVYDAFVAEYRRRLVAELGDQRPYYYAFKRISFHARR